MFGSFSGSEIVAAIAPAILPIILLMFSSVFIHVLRKMTYDKVRYDTMTYDKVS